jgi:hypothetical protein
MLRSCICDIKLGYSKVTGGVNVLNKQSQKTQRMESLGSNLFGSAELHAEACMILYHSRFAFNGNVI